MSRSDQQFSLLTPIFPYNKRANARTTKTNVRAKKRTRARTTERTNERPSPCGSPALLLVVLGLMWVHRGFLYLFFLFLWLVIMIYTPLNLRSRSKSTTPRAAYATWLPITVFGTVTRTVTRCTTNLTEKEDNNFWYEHTTQLPKITWRSSRLNVVKSKRN